MMEFYEDLVDFLKSLDDFFIEVEGRPGQLEKFIEKYNTEMGTNITMNTDGICVLDANVDKWGLDFRLYTNKRPQSPLDNYFHANRAYRPEYRYRLNDNNSIKSLLRDGFSLGHN